MKTRAKDLDPDIAPLRDMLGKLQAAVKANGITPMAANQTMGKLADSLIAARKQPTSSRRRRY